MNLHEYQAKQILLSFGIKIVPFAVASTLDEVKRAIKLLLLKEGAVVKAQIHAGARGKAGGIILANNPEEILAASKKLLGSTLITTQTTELGLPVNSLLITPKVKIKKEYYLGITIDRKRAKPYLIACREGGVSIEEVAEKDPSALFTFALPVEGGIHEFQLMEVIKFMGWKKEQWNLAKEMIRKLVKAFHDADSLLLEINPLVEDEKGDLLALDVKFILDDNALFRQKELASHFDSLQLQKNEREAMKVGFTYVALDGDIGCMVNGAGLAMSVIDLLAADGGKAANFLDIGGIASGEAIIKGLEMILLDERVKVVFIDILGEIVSCELLARALVDAAKKMTIDRPLVVRFFGTDKEKGKRILKEAPFSNYIVETLEEGVIKAIEVAKKRGN